MRDSQDLRAARAVLLELVARLLVSELDAPALAALRHPQLLATFEELEPGCRDYLDHDWSPADFEACAVEFCRLFLLPRQTAPCASAWLAGEPAQSGAVVASRVAVWCARLGIELEGGELGRLPRDHIAVLAGLLAHALQSPGSEALVAAIEDEGLAGWVPAFREGVLEVSENPLYRAVVKLLVQLSASSER